MRISPQESLSLPPLQDSAAINSQAVTPIPAPDTSSTCWDVQGHNFVLVNYRPPGVQMALKNRPIFNSAFESHIS